MHEENTMKITAVSVVLYVIKFHVNSQRVLSQLQKLNSSKSGGPDKGAKLALA